MRKTTTIYNCDGCGKTAKSSRELRRFALVQYGRGRTGREWSDALDLCDSCEARLIETLEPILGASVIELRRMPAAPVRRREAPQAARSRSH